MFNPQYDPMEKLEMLEIQVSTLQHDKMQLVNAINHQASAIGLMNKQVAALIEKSRIQDNQIRLLQTQLQNVSVIQTIGK
jgi:hypothetical protein